MHYPDPRNVPQELRDRPQWVRWLYVWRPGEPKPTKVPYRSNGREASVSDPATWSTLADALGGESDEYDGVGFVVTAEDPYCGIDLDHCIDEAGNVAPWAARMVQALASYTEVTPSGRGLRVWVRGTLPPGGRHRGDVEMYDAGRYFTVTGRPVDGCPLEVADRQDVLLSLHREVFGTATAPTADLPAATVAPHGLSDEDVLAAALRGRHGARLAELLQGGLAGFPSQSEADYSLANILAFYCGDPAQVDRIYRASAAYREKWDRRLGPSTYGARTIARAFAGRSERDFWRPAGSGAGRVSLVTAGGNGRNGAALAPEGPPVKGFPEEPATVPDLVGYALTDVGNAERVLAMHGGELLYVAPWRSWLVWDGRYWARDHEADGDYGAAYRRAVQTVREMAAQFERAQVPADKEAEVRKAWRAHVKSSEGHRKVEATLAVASRYATASLETLDAHPYLLPCLSGTINLHTGALLPHRREDRLTHLIPWEYAPAAPCPTWDAFMASLFPGEPELPAWMWRVLGYSLSGEVSERVVFFVWGSGRNGKSTLLEALRDLMGSYAAVVGSQVIMQRRGEEANTIELAQLPGKRFVACSETTKGRRLNEERIKSLSGAESIQACAKYEMPITYRPQFKLFVATNHKPIILGTDPAIWDRMRFVPFVQRFHIGEEDRTPDSLPADPDLPRKLREEMPGALARMVRGAVEFYANGLGVHPAVLAATAEYRQESDVVGQFIAQQCEIGRGLAERSSALWGRWKMWAASSGEHEGTRRAFGMALRERGFEQFDEGRHDKAHWRGIRLLPNEDVSDEGYRPGSEE